MSLAIAAEVLQGQLVDRDTVFTGVSTDSRSLAPGDLFVPLKGPRFDGHDYLAQAISAGAAGALLGRSLSTSLPHVLVGDTRVALGQLAAFWRRQFDIPVIGITGSNGKTTVKEMTAAILSRAGAICATRGNLNNDIGVPLTLLRLRAGDRFAVVEMGMNHRGEIRYLTGLARPTIAVINNAAEAHLEGLGSVEDVARAKAEILEGLPGDGVAVLNGEDAYCDLWRGLAGTRRVITFALDKAADIRGAYEADAKGYHVQLNTHTGDLAMTLSLLGRHNVMNALAATAASLAAGASLEQVRTGLEKLQAVSGRLELKQGISGARVIDDTYNANGERVLVLGDMGELGAQAESIHERVGELANQIGLQRLYAIGPLSRLAVKRFGKGGRHFKEPQALIETLIDCMHAEMTILIKGSRFMQMERIVAGLVRDAGQAAAHRGS